MKYENRIALDVFLCLLEKTNCFGKGGALLNSDLLNLKEKPSSSQSPEFDAENGSILPGYEGLIAYSESEEHGVFHLED